MNFNGHGNIVLFKVKIKIFLLKLDFLKCSSVWYGLLLTTPQSWLLPPFKVGRNAFRKIMRNHSPDSSSVTIHSSHNLWSHIFIYISIKYEILDYDCTLTTSTTLAVHNLTLQGLSKPVFACGTMYINNLSMNIFGPREMWIKKYCSEYSIESQNRQIV